MLIRPAVPPGFRAARAKLHPIKTLAFRLLCAGALAGMCLESLAAAPTVGQPPAPAISSPLVAQGVVGQEFSYVITATNSPTKYGAATLVAGSWTIAPGLSGNASTGHVFGKPTTPGTFTINLSARNAAGKGTAVLVLTVAPAAPAAPAVVAKPRVAAMFLRRISKELEADVGRFGLVITGLAGDRPDMQATIDGMRRVNPALKLGVYTVIVEADPTPSSRSNLYEAAQAVALNDWWLYDGGGRHVQWSTAYGTDVVNITKWAPADAQGRRYPQWMADHKAGVLAGLRGLDYVYVDNTWYMPRPRTGWRAWKRNGFTQASDDPEIQSAFRQAQLDYWSALRSRLPGIRVMGNADSDLGYIEFKGNLEGAFLECAFGKSWSILRRGWPEMMDRYRAMLANTAEPKDVILEGCGPQGPDLAMLRFGLASALLEDGWFAYTSYADAEHPQPFWADEYAADLGSPSEAAPVEATASGIWMRRYSNGLVLVNPGATTASVQVGPGYRHLSGAQDPVVNNGLAVSTVTLLPRRGVILLRQ